MSTSPEAQYGNSLATPESVPQWERIGTALDIASTDNWTSWRDLLKGNPCACARGDITSNGLIQFLNERFQGIETRIGGKDQFEVRRKPQGDANADPAVQNLFAIHGRCEALTSTPNGLYQE